MKDTFPMILVGIVALFVGVLASWFFMGTADSPAPAANHSKTSPSVANP